MAPIFRTMSDEFFRLAYAALRKSRSATTKQERDKLAADAEQYASDGGRTLGMTQGTQPADTPKRTPPA
jgi:hypothetical protein